MTESQSFQMEHEKKIPRIYSVSEITGDVKSILESAFDSVWVEGEISNLRIPGSKHAYFILKDDNSQIRCVLFKGYRTGLKFQPEDGDQVLLFGRVTVYEVRGEYQLIVEHLEPRGLGALQKAFENLKNQLSREGLFDEDKKKPIPKFPWKIGVITSATGAAIRDILSITKRRNPKVSVLVYPVQVQGKGSAEEIAEALEQMNGIKKLDVIILGRGGGSIEDLWAFNEEIVARAIYKSTIPVVSAVGHEIDFTISDFISDVRAPTPSAAAELVVPILDITNKELNRLVKNLFESLKNQIDDYKILLQHLMERRFFREPINILNPHSQRLDDLNTRLFRGLNQWVVLQKQKLSGMTHQLAHLNPKKIIVQLKEKIFILDHRLTQNIHAILRLDIKRFDGALKNLNALSPLSILNRGYSITTVGGKAITTSDGIKPGDSISVRLTKGQLECTVNKITLNQNTK